MLYPLGLKKSSKEVKIYSLSIELRFKNSAMSATIFDRPQHSLARLSPGLIIENTLVVILLTIYISEFVFGPTYRQIICLTNNPVQTDNPPLVLNWPMAALVERPGNFDLILAHIAYALLSCSATIKIAVKSLKNLPKISIVYTGDSNRT